MQEKELVFINLKKFLADDGTLFGATISGKGVESDLLYNAFNAFYNKRRIFTNYNDDIESPEIILEKNLVNTHLKWLERCFIFMFIVINPVWKLCILSFFANYQIVSLSFSETIAWQQ